MQDSLIDDPKDSMFLAFAILDVKNVDEYMDLQKEIYLPKLEQDEGIISYGAFESAENTLVLNTNHRSSLPGAGCQKSNKLSRSSREATEASKYKFIVLS